MLFFIILSFRLTLSKEAFSSEKIETEINGCSIEDMLLFFFFLVYSLMTKAASGKQRYFEKMNVHYFLNNCR